MTWTLKTISSLAALVASVSVLLIVTEANWSPPAPVALTMCAIVGAFAFFWAVPIWLVSTLLLVLKGALSHETTDRTEQG